MKKCRTLDGLLSAIKKNEKCYLEYTEMRSTMTGYIIYATNGTNIIVEETTYNTIKDHLVKA